MIAFFVKKGTEKEFLLWLQNWLIDNPAKGALYMSLFYMIGIPLSFPSSFLVFFGAYTATHVFGFYCNNISLLFLEGLIIMFLFNMIFAHLGHLFAFLIGRYFFRGFFK